LGSTDEDDLGLKSLRVLVRVLGEAGRRQKDALPRPPAVGGRIGYNPKNKGKKSYQPILTFIAETREYISGELRNGDRPDGKQIARHLAEVFAALPGCVRDIYARADFGFYCWDAVQAYEKAKAEFIMVARKTSRLVEQLQSADWKPSFKTDADQQCEFWYQPEGWGKAYRFIALRYHPPGT
jgi:hypothetical protein